MYIPIFDQVSATKEDLKMVKVDIDTISSETNNKYGVSSVPTTIIIKGGKVLNKTLGFMTGPQLTKLISDTIKK